MPDIPVTPEIADFIANTIRATRTGTLKWEPLGDKGLIAKLDDYQVELREVPDLDGNSGESDHLLSLYEGDRKLFTVDRRDVSGEELSRALGERYEYSYPAFSELWQSALMTALNLREHLDKVNAFLQRGVSRRT